MAWAKRDPAGRARWQQLKYPGDPINVTVDQQANNWNHTIAVVDGKLLDFEVTEPLSSLWLRQDNQPDPERGYMRTIRKVWRVYKCCAGADLKGVCKGECSVIGMRHSECA